MHSTVTCEKCGKQYQKNDKIAQGREPICYSCALKGLTVNGGPEEGDFNTASLISGQMSDQEYGWLQEDLKAVESGRSSFEPYEDNDDEDAVDYEQMYSYQEDDDERNEDPESD